MGLSCAAGRRPVRQRVVGDNRNGAQWGWQAGLGLERDHVDMKWCFIGDGGEGGGKRTYSYSTSALREWGKNGLVPFFDTRSVRHHLPAALIYNTAYFVGTQNISCHERIPQGLRRNW